MSERASTGARPSLARRRSFPAPPAPCAAALRYAPHTRRNAFGSRHAHAALLIIEDGRGGEVSSNHRSD